mgnify:CR=1 FL=1
MFLNNPECIHSAIFAKALEVPNATALVARNTDGSYTEKSYAELSENALKVATALKASGIQSQGLVAIVLPKGMNQVFCSIGIQAVGASYVPVGVHQPMERMRKIFETAKISGIVTDRFHAESIRKENPEWNVVVVEDALQSSPMPIEDIVEDPASLAYIIFTSGTTGVPKGVMITHRAASNTIRDINSRFDVGPGDTAIALSQLDFDLSVYDIFGVLSAGGKLAVLSEETKKEANVWKTIAREQKVTLWNSVPALFEMFTIVSADCRGEIPLKTVMLSGDWIPLPLYGTTKKLWPGCRFVSLGGATEVSIWSVYYEVTEMNPEWKSIPYGKALKNQSICVMNEFGQECVPGEAGELWIGGIGVAEGYLNQPDLTKEHFVERNGERWYRTGDKARMHADGNSEFLGRLDTQVKLGGYRIELGEIENVIKKNPGVANATAVVIENGSKRELAAAVIPQLKSERRPQWNYREASSASAKSFAENLAERTAAVSAFINEVLKISPKVSSEMEPVIGLWKQWLSDNGLDSRITGEGEPGSELKRTLLDDATVRTMQQVLSGERNANDLLQFEIFAPEKLLAEGDSFKEFIAETARTAKQDAAKRIAFLNARSGIAVKEFLREFNSEDIEISLFDESAGMLDMARENLQGEPSKILYRTLNLSESVKDIESFDIVIDAGFLHTYSNPVEAITFAYLILKKGGKLMALDFENFDSIAIVSSAVLEKGFVNYTRHRRYTSLLTDGEWESVLNELPFEKIEFANDSHFSQTILAQKPADSGTVLGEKFDSYLKANLVPYMIPARTEVFVKFPLTSNAKVDRKAITKLLEKSAPLKSVDENYEGKEADIAKIWKELLSIDRVDRKANFFEIGGDSLLATRFLEKVHTQFGVEISLREIFENAELDKLACILDTRMAELGDMEEGEI